MARSTACGSSVLFRLDPSMRQRSVDATLSLIPLDEYRKNEVRRGESKVTICTRFAKTPVNPIMPEIAVRIGLPASMPIWPSAHGSAARFDAEPREGVVDNLREVVVVADDEGEDADIEGFPDEPRDHVLVRRHRPEQAGQRGVDGDEDVRKPADIALHKAEPGIDVLGEGPKKLSMARSRPSRLPAGRFFAMRPAQRRPSVPGHR